MAEEIAVETLSYEEAMAELDRLIARLEEDQVPLEEALAGYERGAHLLTRCSSLLEGVELRVAQLSLGSDGEARERPFDLPEESPAGGES